MHTNKRRVPDEFFYILPLLAGAKALGFMLITVLSRWHYPYELEWIEGSVLQHVVRILEGKPLYVLPDMAYAPALYTPGYYYVSALSAYFVGAGLPALRLVSLLSSIASGFLIVCMAWMLTRSRLAALLSFFLYAGMFRFTGYWFDVGRVDSFWVFWLMAALCSLVAFYNHLQATRWVVFSAICLAISVMVKQSSLLLFPFFACAVLLWSDWRKVLLFCGVATAIVVLFFAVAQYCSEGMFWFYTMGMMGHHGTTKGFPGYFVYMDLLFSIPFYLALSFVFLYKAQASRASRMGWLALFLGFICLSFNGRFYIGGYLNAVMPMDLMVALFSAVGFAGCIASSNFFKGRFLWMLLLTINIAWAGWFSPVAEIPSTADRAYGDALVVRIANVQGRVCLTRQGYLAYLAGKEFCAHETQLTDIISSGDVGLKDRIFADIRAKISAGYYDAIIVDSMPELSGYLDVNAIPYTVSELDEDKRSPLFYPVINGPRPHLWLDYKKP